MRSLSIVRLGAIAAITAGISFTGRTEAAPAAGASIILFGARWCAPCMAEYKYLDDLASAAAPDHLILAWIDRPINPPVALASRIQVISAAKARDLAVATAGVGYGLPFSVMLNAAGRPCALWRGPLDRDHITRMRRECLS